MSTREEDELVEALKVVKKACESYKDCGECCMAINNECVLANNSPDNWNIKPVHEFKAFGN